MKIKRSTLVLWKKRLMIFLGSALVFSLFYIYFGTSLFTITTYELVGVPDMYKDTSNVRLRAIASQKMVGFIPADKILNYRGMKIKQAVVSILPNTETISLLPIGLHTLRVKVTSYQPLYRIDDTHAITKDGFIYSESQDISTLPLIVVASSTTKETLNDGITSISMVGIDTRTLKSLSTFINKINSVVFKVSKIEIDEYGDISLYDERGMSKLLYRGDADIDKVWSNLVSAIDTNPLKEDLEKNKDKLEYLDARFGNKVFFKFTNAGKTAIIQSHATTTQVTASTTTLLH